MNIGSRSPAALVGMITLIGALGACKESGRAPEAPPPTPSPASAIVEEEPALEEAAASTEPGTGSGLRKGLGGTNGDADFCANPNNRCVAGEGDCDTNLECVQGLSLICAADNGARFSMLSTNDVCVPGTCVNRRLDAGESAVDCGGSCGSCEPTGCDGLPNGHNDRCTYHCKCGAGFGDCDANDNCSTGMVCAADIGARFTWASTLDVCVPAHCTNRVQDAAAGEERIDCGGPCGACTCPGTNGDGSFCTPSCQCALGQGDCDTNLDCQDGMVCAQDNGATYGLAASLDTCVPAQCANKRLDPGEISIDCGGPCGGSCARLAGGPVGAAVSGEAGGVKVQGSVEWQGQVRGEANGVRIEGGFR